MSRFHLEYRGHIIEGMHGCSAVVVSFSTDNFSWDIFCPSIHAAKLRISRHIKEQQNG